MFGSTDCIIGTLLFDLSVSAEDARHNSLHLAVTCICDEGSMHERSGDVSGAAHAARVWIGDAERARRARRSKVRTLVALRTRTSLQHTSVDAIDVYSIAGNTPPPSPMVERWGWCCMRP
jgi:hypothetical protein